MTVLFVSLGPSAEHLERPRLEKLFNHWAPKGPDGSWVNDSSVAWIGQHLLRITTLCQSRPGASRSNEARASLVASVRLDDRTNLVNSFPESERHRLLHASHQDLLLECYLRWGMDWLRHVTGEFCGVLFDELNDRVIAFTDRMGIRPLYLYESDSEVLISTELSLLIAHPNVNLELDPQSLGRFLIFGHHDFGARSRTPFAKISRLNGGRQRIFSDRQAKDMVYWEFPSDPTENLPRRPVELKEAFREVLRSAILDRAQGAATGLLLSGGLDSGAIGAMLAPMTAGSDGPIHLRSYTGLKDSRDEERRFAEHTLSMLGLSSHRWVDYSAEVPLASYQPTAVPLQDPFPSASRRQVHLLSADGCRSIIRGTAADALLRNENWTLSDAFAKLGPIGGLGCALTSFAELPGRPAFGLRKKFGRTKSKQQRNMARDWRFPVWLSQDFERENDLELAWQRAIGASACLNHSLRPQGRSSLELVGWHEDTFIPSPVVYTFKTSDPFLDARVINFALSLQPLPWTQNKHLIRSAFSTLLPKPVLQRPKTPAGDLLAPHATGSWWHQRRHEIDQVVELQEFVQLSKLPDYTESVSMGRSFIDLRPIILGLWIKGLQHLRNSPESGLDTSR